MLDMLHWPLEAAVGLLYFDASEAAIYNVPHVGANKEYAEQEASARGIQASS
jgi:hypothetical protein